MPKSTVLGTLGGGRILASGFWYGWGDKTYSFENDGWVEAEI